MTNDNAENLRSVLERIVSELTKALPLAEKAGHAQLANRLRAAKLEAESELRNLSVH